MRNLAECDTRSFYVLKCEVPVNCSCILRGTAWNIGGNTNIEPTSQRRYDLPMAESKRRSDFYLLFLGLLLGYIMTSFIAAKYLVWYAESPVPNVMDCSKHIDWGVNRLIQWQAAGMFVFAIGMWTAGKLLRNRTIKLEEKKHDDK